MSTVKPARHALQATPALSGVHIMLHTNVIYEHIVSFPVKYDALALCALKKARKRGALY